MSALKSFFRRHTVFAASLLHPPSILLYEQNHRKSIKWLINFLSFFKFQQKKSQNWTIYQFSDTLGSDKIKLKSFWKSLQENHKIQENIQKVDFFLVKICWLRTEVFWALSIDLWLLFLCCETSNEKLKKNWSYFDHRRLTLPSEHADKFRKFFVAHNCVISWKRQIVHQQKVGWTKVERISGTLSKKSMTCCPKSSPAKLCAPIWGIMARKLD